MAYDKQPPGSAWSYVLIISAVALVFSYTVWSAGRDEANFFWALFSAAFLGTVSGGALLLLRDAGVRLSSLLRKLLRRWLRIDEVIET